MPCPNRPLSPKDLSSNMGILRRFPEDGGSSIYQNFKVRHVVEMLGYSHYTPRKRLSIVSCALHFLDINSPTLFKNVYLILPLIFSPPPQVGGRSPAGRCMRRLVSLSCVHPNSCYILLFFLGSFSTPSQDVSVISLPLICLPSDL